MGTGFGGPGLNGGESVGAAGCHAGPPRVSKGQTGSQGLPMILKGSPGRGLSCRALPEQNDQTKEGAKCKSKKKEGEEQNLEQKQNV